MRWRPRRNHLKDRVGLNVSVMLPYVMMSPNSTNVFLKRLDVALRLLQEMNKEKRAQFLTTMALSPWPWPASKSDR